jgi:hypothetical protein
VAGDGPILDYRRWVAQFGDAATVNPAVFTADAALSPSPGPVG